MIPTILDLPRRLLVIAPHPDDESLGCGGLIARNAASGGSVCTVFVTDGGASHPGSRLWPRARLARQREEEAVSALSVLGAGDEPRYFLQLPDADMPSPRDLDWVLAKAQLQAIIDNFRPDLALVPWRRDPHRDHRDSWELASRAISGSNSQIEMLEYAIWLPEFGVSTDHPEPGEVAEWRINIADWLHLKNEAVMAHRSQTTDLVSDDPLGFRLTPETITRLCSPVETYWRVNEAH